MSQKMAAVPVSGQFLSKLIAKFRNPVPLGLRQPGLLLTCEAFHEAAYNTAFMLGSVGSPIGGQQIVRPVIRPRQGNRKAGTNRQGFMDKIVRPEKHAR